MPPFVAALGIGDAVHVDQSRPQRGGGKHKITPAVAYLRCDACYIESVWDVKHIGIDCEDIQQYILVEVEDGGRWCVI